MKNVVRMISLVLVFVMGCFSVAFACDAPEAEENYFILRQRQRSEGLPDPEEWISTREACSYLYHNVYGYGMPVLDLILTEASSIIIQYTLEGERVACYVELLGMADPCWRIDEDGNVQIRQWVLEKLEEQLVY